MPRTVGQIMRGMVEPGNINVSGLPAVPNPETGGYSTVWSLSIGTPAGEVLIPRVKNGRILSEDEAIDAFYRTGEHLGIFRTPKDADRYAERLHQEQEQATKIDQLLRALKF